MAVELALLVAWATAKLLAVFVVGGGGGALFGVASLWTLSVISAVLVLTLAAVTGFEMHRLRGGLHDAGIALHSMELVTDPSLSFLPLEQLLDELLARTTQVVGGDVATIFMVDPDGRSLSVRAVHDDELGLAPGSIPFGSGIVGGVASQAKARIVVDATAARIVEDAWLEPMASLLAAPLLQAGRVIGVVLVGARESHAFAERDLHLLELVAERAAASIERARLDDSVRRSRLGAEQARRHLDLLARASDVLAPALESHEDHFVRLVEVVVPAFADWFAVDLVDDTGTRARVAEGARGEAARGARAVHADPSGAAARRFGRHRHPEGDRLVRRALETGRPEVVLDSSRISTRHSGQLAVRGEFTDAVPTAGVESMMVVPVHVRGLAFGALSFVTEPGRRGYRRSDLDTAMDLAQRVAVTVERVLLWRDTRRAEAVAVRHAAQLRRLVEAALGVNAPLEEPEVLRVLAEHARHVLGADWTVVYADHGDGAGTTVVSPRAAPSAVAVSPALLESLCADVLGASHPLRGRISDDGPYWLGTRMALADGTGTSRALLVFSVTGSVFGPEDESVLLLLTQMGSEALENARLYQAVQGNEERLQAVVESSPLAIAELDLQGEARWWNSAAAALFGWPSPGTAEPKTRRIPTRHRGELELERLLERARSGDATVGVELAALDADGKLRDLSASTAPLRDHAGVVRGILAVMEDVTERLAMVEQFHQAERVGAMARLAGAVAHDFNNLLTVILGSSELLARGVSYETARDEVEAIQRAGKRAAALTSQLLAIGQRAPVKPVVTDPDMAVASMMPMLARVMGPGVTVEHVGAETPQRISVDPTELERAVLNLAINANDAMPEGGTFTLITSRQASAGGSGAEVVLSVADDGVGMSDEVAAHCFEPFFTTKERARGTGLGLAAVHAMVTQAGGRVIVTSALGHGTTFILAFPAVEGDPAPEATGVRPDLSRGNETLLLVEDEDEVRRLAVQALESRGYTVLQAASGAEALALTRGMRRRPHLLVTDVVMPGMSGMDLARELSARWPVLPVLYVSGHIAQDTVDQGLVQPEMDLLVKPFTSDQLGRRVRQALERAAQGSKR